MKRMKLASRKQKRIEDLSYQHRLPIAIVDMNGKERWCTEYVADLIFSYHSISDDITIDAFDVD